MKTFVRMLALVLALLTCVLVVSSCTTILIPVENENYNSSLDEYGREKDDLAEKNLNFEGDIVTVLYWSDREHAEFEAKTLTNENVNDAIYQRNLNICDRLNVELNFVGEPGNVSHRAGFVRRVSAVNDAGTKDFDLIASYSRTEGMLAIQGYLVELTGLKTSYINLEKPWWPQQLIDTVKVNDSVYFLSGDCSTNVLHMMYAIYYNKDMVSKLGLTDPATMVYPVTDERNVTGKPWTIDRLIELTQDVYSDLDGSKTPTEGDQYGFCTINFHLDAFYTGSNMRLIEHTSDGTWLKISDDYGSAKTVKLVNKLGKWLNAGDCWVSKGSRDTVKYEQPFKNGKALFCQNRAHMAGNSLTKVDWSYGIVPTPKYDDKQVNYYSVVGNPFTLYGIYSDLANRKDGRDATLAEMTAIIECWGSEGYRLTTPQIFNVNMQLKYSESQQETDMFEYVRSAITFDLGRIFSNDLAFMSELPSHAAVSNSSWSTAYGAYKKSLTKKLEIVVEAFKTQSAL